MRRRGRAVDFWQIKTFFRQRLADCLKPIQMFGDSRIDESLRVGIVKEDLKIQELERLSRQAYRGRLSDSVRVEAGQGDFFVRCRRTATEDGAVTHEAISCEILDVYRAFKGAEHRKWGETIGRIQAEIAFEQFFLNRERRLAKEPDKANHSGSNAATRYRVDRVYGLREGFEAVPIYQPRNVQRDVKRELSGFLRTFDELCAPLRVFEDCPIFRQGHYWARIQAYLSSQKLAPRQLLGKSTHKAFCDAFLSTLVFAKEPALPPEVEESFSRPVLGRRLYELALEELKRRFDIQRKDDFLREILFPKFYRLWRLEIDAVTLQDAAPDKEKEASLRFSESEEGDAIAASFEDQEAALKEREEMRRFWQLLLGS